ncbi:MAG TPA: hypothetical protein VJT75_17525 [Thermoleophilaceae bacterium]|nr:hypothetical protein [Thermoleophilaceae bacterium]
MQTGSYTIAYIATDIEPGMTLDEYRRSLPRSEPSPLRRAARAMRRTASRYLDDPSGDYETTSGVW